MNNAEDLILELQKTTAQNAEENINNYYDELYNVQKKSLTYLGGHNHCHKCDFEMLHNKKQAILLCKNYLRTKHMKRDRWMECCDNADCGGCKHMKFILVSEDNTIITCH